MELEWDKVKRQWTLENCHLDFADVAFVDLGSVVSEKDNRHDYGEFRFSSYALLDGVLINFCWTLRGNRIRIISMRKRMTANARSIKRDREPGSMDGIRPGESLDDFEKRVGDDAPEWTEEDFKRARPISEFPELLAAFERARGQRGPQKAPVKDRVGLRLDHGVVEHFRATGPGWQSRINDILADYVKQHSK